MIGLNFTSIGCIRCVDDRSNLSGSEGKNVWNCTSTDSILCTVGRSTVFGFDFKMCGAVPLLAPYDVQLTAHQYLVFSL